MNRREFLQWSTLVYFSLVVFFFDLLKKIFDFIIGPTFSKNLKKRLLLHRIETLEKTAKLEKLKYERLTRNKLLISKVEDLSTEEALPFIDFNLRPGLAYLNTSGEIVVRSALCTHLGCAVRNTIEDGKLLCPCHNALFDANTGENVGGPAVSPLEKIEHQVEDGKLFIVTSAPSTGDMS